MCILEFFKWKKYINSQFIVDYKLKMSKLKTRRGYKLRIIKRPTLKVFNIEMRETITLLL